jgi:hypothetical protein
MNSKTPKKKIQNETLKIFAALSLGLLLSACNNNSGSNGGTGGSGASGGTTFGYGSGSGFIMLVANEPNSINPNAGQQITSCSISPALPAPLVFNTSTCALTGAPRGAFAASNYTVTATGPAGTATVTIAISSVLPSETLQGIADVSFGTNGIVQSVANNNNQGVINSVINSDGSSYVLMASTLGYYVIDHILSSGAEDPNFIYGGAAFTCSSLFGNSSCSPLKLVVQNDGKVIVGSYVGNSVPLQWGIARYNTNGSLDTSYGTSGVVVQAAASLENDPTSFGMTIEASTGNLVILAQGWIADNSQNGFDVYPYLARLLPTGAMDLTFASAGGTGDAMYLPAIGTAPRGFAYDPNSGAFIIAGANGNAPTISGPANGGEFIRVNSDGTLDTSFGGLGTGGLLVNLDDNAVFQFQSTNIIVTIQYADSSIIFTSNAGYSVHYLAEGERDSNWTSPVFPSAVNVVGVIVEPSEDILYLSQTAIRTRAGGNGGAGGSGPGGPGGPGGTISYNSNIYRASSSGVLDPSMTFASAPSANLFPLGFAQLSNGEILIGNSVGNNNTGGYNLLMVK